MVFGPGLLEVFAAFGNDTRIAWQLTPAIESPSEPCLIESNCNWEKRTVCAFNSKPKDLSSHVAFLVCMDEHKSGPAPPADTKYFNAAQAAEACARKTGIENGLISKCYSDGTAMKLLRAAEKAWAPYFGVDVPHVLIKGQKTYDFHDGNITCVAPFSLIRLPV